MEKKTKSKLSLFICCSSIELKGKKKKNNNNAEELATENDKEEIFTAIFGENSKRSSAFICCSSVEAGATKSSPPSPRNGPFNLALRFFFAFLIACFRTRVRFQVLLFSKNFETFFAFADVPLKKGEMVAW
ncbi:hypothetical protein RHMOL_Rhmol07G0079600 [Rhododendron molle]|uniref:Uncharacterized protein n=1 Tax=Rhododendron molle TaxID=49168 RepID=A0ACC0MZF9_RHOML|nr:hypothetical protein RHMOL_Rhmol07G0079600 [Rhododendron molle]